MKNAKSLMRLIVMIVVLSSLVMTSTINVSMGSNGQQIQIYVCNASRVVIQGHNQNGSSVSNTLNNPTRVAIGITLVDGGGKVRPPYTLTDNVSSKYPYYYLGRGLINKCPCSAIQQLVRY